jgi:hypothetical protein
MKEGAGVFGQVSACVLDHVVDRADGFTGSHSGSCTLDGIPRGLRHDRCRAGIPKGLDHGIDTR